MKSPYARNLDGNWYKQPGCRSNPFFESLKFENVIIDELHCMLRVTDRLEEGLIKDILQWDEVYKIIVK